MSYYKAKHSVDLKLTKREQHIIQSDMSLFGCKALEAFCNKIFENYDKNLINSDDWGDLSKKNKTIQKIGKSDQMIGTKVNLRPKTVDFLNNEFERNFSVEYYDKYERKLSTNYVNLVLKSYSNLQFYERERIYFKEHFNTINNAIDKNQQLIITTGGRHFHCSIYKIMVESNSTYIICKSAEIANGELQEPKYGSFRFLYITDVRYTDTVDDLCINEFDGSKSKIEDKIFYNGIQFFLDDVELIRVKFSDEGIKKYNSIRNVRPFEYGGWEIKDKERKEEFVLQKKRDDLNNIKTFKCTRKQMEFYLFQFGGEAEILEPIDLREEFLEKYKKAVEVYSTPPEVGSKSE